MHYKFKDWYEEQKSHSIKMSKSKGKVIVGFNGSGKSLAGKRFHNVLDLESGYFQFDVNPELLYVEIENQKFDMSRLQSENYLQDYIKTILDAIQHFDYVCVAQNELLILSLVFLQDIEVILVCSKKSNKDEYLKRYVDRQNTEEFVEWMSENYDVFIDRLKSIANDFNLKFITLKENQYLSDFIQSL